MHETIQNARVPILGIDIGRVILADATDIRDSIFSRDNYINANFTEGAEDALTSLVEMVGSRSVYLVSKCSPTIQKRTTEVLEHHKFFNNTGLVRDNLLYCEQRYEKAVIAEQLGLTHFVDDRVGVLKSMPESVGSKFLFYADSTASIPYEFLREESDIYPVRGWQSAILAIEQTIAKKEKV